MFPSLALTSKIESRTLRSRWRSSSAAMSIRKSRRRVVRMRTPSLHYSQTCDRSGPPSTRGRGKLPVRGNDGSQTLRRMNAVTRMTCARTCPRRRSPSGSSPPTDRTSRTTWRKCYSLYPCRHLARALWVRGNGDARSDDDDGDGDGDDGGHRLSDVMTRSR